MRPLHRATEQRNHKRLPRAVSLLWLTSIFAEAGTLSVNGGVLLGSGVINADVVIQSGRLAPGGPSTEENIGCPNLASLTMNSGGTLTLDIEGNSVCSARDQVTVSGSPVTLNSPTLQLYLSSTAAQLLTGPVTLIDKQSSGAVTGAFFGLPQGADIGLASLEIRYDGGNGNDVVLARVEGVPDSPSFEQEDSGPDSITILLAPGASTGSGPITGYRLICTDNEGTVVYNQEQGSANFDVTDLEPGETYSCSATAINATGYSYASSTQVYETLPNTGLPIWLLYEASTP